MSVYDNAILKISEIFDSLEIPYIVIGASARDIFCVEFGLPMAMRKTSDVDFGIFVKDWDELKRAEEVLQEHPDVEKKGERENKVRYYYRGTPFDIIPFGGVEKNGKVSWPPFYDTIMTVVGYKEALENSVDVLIEGCSVKVVCVEILIGLKLIAWNENNSRQKDISDIWYLISGYSKIDPSSYEYIIDHYSHLLERFEYEFEFAEPLHIGLKQNAMFKDDVKKLLIKILDDQDKLERIAAIALSEKIIEEDMKDQERTKVKRMFEAIKIALIG